MQIDPKRRTILTFAEAEDMHAKLAESAASTAKWLAAQTSDPMSLLRAMRFDTVGHDPLTGEPLNVVEQLNQTFTILVTSACHRAIVRTTSRRWWLSSCPWTSSGRDIESVKERLVAAEVFSATRPTSNQKLKKDQMRLSSDPAQHRYVFFCCPGYSAGRQPELETISGIQVYAVDL